MKTIALLSLFLLPSAASAGSCGKEIYSCISASQKYRIEMSYCLFENNMGGNEGFDSDTGKGFVLTIGGRKVSDASLSAGWDGPTLGAFELSLPNQGATERRISVEFFKKTGNGTLLYQARDEQPGSFKTVLQEQVHCEIE